MLRKFGKTVPWLLLAAAVLLSLGTGKFHIDPAKLADPLSADSRVFLNLRLGRTCAALVSGAVLGTAGFVFQTVFRNPLASPDVAGVASGASAGAALSILLFSGMSALTPALAFAGGLLAMLIVVLLNAATERFGIASLVVCGVCVNALFQAALTVIKLCADREHIIASIEFWLMGSFSAVTLKQLLRVLPFALAGMAGLVILRRPVTLLAFSDDEADMLGVPVSKTRAAALLLSTLSVSAVISLSGLISFVGLLAPHIARLLAGRKKDTFMLSAVIGALLLLIADILARSAAATELPVSVFTSFLGVPCLLGILFARNRREV